MGNILVMEGSLLFMISLAPGLFLIWNCASLSHQLFLGKIVTLVLRYTITVGIWHLKKNLSLDASKKKDEYRQTDNMKLESFLKHE